MTLLIKQEFHDEILDEGRLEKVIREYGIFIPYRIHIGNITSQPINVLQPVIYELSSITKPNPIRFQSPPERQQETNSVEIRFQQLWDTIYGDLGMDPPITILPLVSNRTRGMLFFPSSPAFSEMGRVRLWCRRMFVKSNEEDLLPAWSRTFISGIIDCTADPNLSRTELLRSNEQDYQHLKEEIENDIVRQLGILSTFGEQWQRILSQYRSVIIYAANVNLDLMKRIGDSMPFRKAVSIGSTGQDKDAVIELGGYKRQMDRRRGDESELPIGTTVSQDNLEDLKRHRKTVYYYTGEGSLAGIIEKHTVLHAQTQHDVSFLQQWCELNGYNVMNVGHELPFEPALGFDHFIEVVRDAIGTDVDKRHLNIRTVKLEHRRDIPCILTSESPRGRKQDQYMQELNAMPGDEFEAVAKNVLKHAPIKFESLSRHQIAEILVQSRIVAEEMQHENRPGHSQREFSASLSSQEVLYINMANELMLNLALDSQFDTVAEKQFRALALHEVWHGAKIARGEPVVHPNSEHHFQTATHFLTRVLEDIYLPGRKAKQELEIHRQIELDRTSK